MAESDKGLDVLGLKPIAKAIETVTTGIVDGSAAFLSRICLPAAEEFGLLLRDRVSSWRATNLAKITEHAEKLLEQRGDGVSVSAHPRIVANVVELGSWTDSEELQQMWAGLLASACTENGQDESNLMFLDLLSKLTASQVRLYDYSCKNTEKGVTPGGWICASELIVDLETLMDVSGLSDFHRLDLELDHLRVLGLLVEFGGGFKPESTDADLTPSALGLQMYARCRGWTGDPITFFDAKPFPVSEELQEDSATEDLY